MKKTIFHKEIEKLINEIRIDLNLFAEKTFFITGATGLIGMTLIKVLLYMNDVKDLNIKIVAMIRDEKKAEQIFSDFKKNKNLSFYIGDVNNRIIIKDKIDYVVHGASITSSKLFVDKPVDTIDTAIVGSKNVFDFAVLKSVKKVVYLSSMEIYGLPQDDDYITENNYQYIDHMNIRSSYPESKKMVENMCVAYAKQFGLNTNILRLTQTFGPGVEINDNRIFAEFARCVIESKDIILHTKGETKRCYLYTMDAVSAILTVALKGEVAQVYNAANMKTYCSIYEMAEKVITLSKNKINLIIEECDIEKMGYAPTLKMNLDTSRLNKLGWYANTEMIEMYKKMIESMKESEKNG